MIPARQASPRWPGPGPPAPPRQTIAVPASRPASKRQAGRGRAGHGAGRCDRQRPVTTYFRYCQWRRVDRLLSGCQYRFSVIRAMCPSSPQVTCSVRRHARRPSGRGALVLRASSDDGRWQRARWRRNRPAGPSERLYRDRERHVAMVGNARRLQVSRNSGTRPWVAPGFGRVMLSWVSLAAGVRRILLGNSGKRARAGVNRYAD